MSKNRPKVALVTPIHNGIEYTLPYLESVYKLDYPNLEMIIIDDGSSDGSRQKIETSYPKTIVIGGDGNLWWSGATNLGVKRAKQDGADYIFTVNNDVMLEPKLISQLVATAEAHPKSLVGCKIYFIDDRTRVWYFGCQLDDKLADIYINTGRDEDFTKLYESGALTGMGVLIPAEAFDQIGLYDAQNFPQYHADSDFSLRAKQAGYNLLVDPSAKLYSDVGSSWVQRQLKHPSPKFVWQMFFHMRSPYSFAIRYRFYKRHWGKKYLWMWLKFYLLMAAKIVGYRPSPTVPPGLK